MIYLIMISCCVDWTAIVSSGAVLPPQPAVLVVIYFTRTIYRGSDDHCARARWPGQLLSEPFFLNDSLFLPCLRLLQLRELGAAQQTEALLGRPPADRLRRAIDYVTSGQKATIVICCCSWF